MDLMEELWNLNKLLTKSLEQLKERAKKYAKSQRDYRVMLRQEMLKLRAEGTPVTIIGDLARGKQEVADAKEKEIIDEGLYKSCQEAINTYKLQIRLLQAQINNEWGGKNE